ncbi:MAG: response regulator transcription factor [Candidatus Obscuribacterales bacterium]|nr:response regulator transcription factor [Candidatus Obscuribacterales bacterium]
MAKVLLVDDDLDMSEVIRHTLVSRGFTVQTAPDGASALDMLRVNKYDVIVLDWMMPGVSGVDVCRRLRSAGNKTPILMLTCLTSADDKETGLDAGADDYLSKPFENKELAARLRALLRRPPDYTGTVLQAGDITLDPLTQKVCRGGKELSVRPMVTKLLEFLLRHPNQFFTAEALLERVWHDDSLASLDTIRSHIKLLRRSIDLEGQASIIKTERNKGYRLEVPASE